MAKVISVFNNKGRIGKSTICWNLADALGSSNKRVLLIDFDPQTVGSLLLQTAHFARLLATNQKAGCSNHSGRTTLARKISI